MRKNLIVALVVFMVVGRTSVVFADDKNKGQNKKPVFDLIGRLASVDTEKRSIAVTFKSAKKDGGGGIAKRTLALAKEVEITVDDRKPASLGDLAKSKVVFLKLSDDKTSVRIVQGHGPTIRGRIKAVDATARTITLARFEKKGEPPAPKSFAVGKEARIELDRGLEPKDKTGREVELGELNLELWATARLSVDGHKILSLRAEAPSVEGAVKAVDVDRRSVTIAAGKGGAETAYTFSDEASVVLDDMTGQKSSHRKGTIKDVRIGSRAKLRLTVDSSKVIRATVSGPEYYGVLKTIAKARLTVSVFRTKTEPGEDRTFELAATPRIYITEAGKKRLTPGGVSDLKPGMQVHVRLGADLKTIGSIRAEKP